jgi:hypothetical protein
VPAGDADDRVGDIADCELELGVDAPAGEALSGLLQELLVCFRAIGGIERADAGCGCAARQGRTTLVTTRCAPKASASSAARSSARVAGSLPS